MDFVPFPKVPRLTRDICITEKIDGTNASIYINPDADLFLAASRSRWITPTDDNYGFAKWAYDNKAELMALGAGHHFGEWWGRGIQAGYGVPDKRFSLFNTAKWTNNPALPRVCSVVPVIYEGMYNDHKINDAIVSLKLYGSRAAPGWMHPEGIMIYHTAAGHYFKKTITLDDVPKTRAIRVLA